MKISEVFFVMYVHLEKTKMKERQLIIFYNRDNLQPCRAYHQTPVSRTPTEYAMLTMVYITKGQFNQMLRHAKSSCILKDYGVGIPIGEK